VKRSAALLVLAFVLAFYASTLICGGWQTYRYQLASLQDSARNADRRALEWRASYVEARRQADSALRVTRSQSLALAVAAQRLAVAVRVEGMGDSTEAQPIPACLALADTVPLLLVAVEAERKASESLRAIDRRAIDSLEAMATTIRRQRDDALSLARRGRPTRLAIGPFVGLDVSGRLAAGVSVTIPVLRL
jgi:hypothetical protein